MTEDCHKRANNNGKLAEEEEVKYKKCKGG